MNTDIRIAVSFKTHRKRKRLRLLLGPGSTDYLLDLWISTAMNHPSGVLSGMDELDISLEAGWEDDPVKFVSALTECGFLEKNQDGEYILHDWEDHQEYVVQAEERKQRARKAAAKRWGLESNATSMPEVCPEHATSMPDAMPLPTFLPTKELRVTPSELCPQPPLASASPAVLEAPEEAEPDDEPPPSQADHPPDCPHEKIIALYHEALPELPRARTWPEHRRKLLRSRHRETWERLRRADKPHGDDDLIAWWKAYFARVRASPFLMGKACDRSGKAFCADLEWLVKPSNYAKVLDGKYLERRPNA